ncbi:amidohydrolase family protein [Paenibacillus sp. FSL H7-0331]|uniref:amidohydrolase family protein n=1 Tax=Paenibacillus sp. FSL H7-0331 TaxID=1920421 RepID=UPI00096EB0B4|nr:amidohydrolase family protein [Paenibacillus sp. FSL H7-0331]OMF11588.1 hypothetical protein BK127_24130 [Paenibacillus sp. FSL H7-0331]
MSLGSLHLINARLPLAEGSPAQLYELRAAKGFWQSVTPQQQQGIIQDHGSIPLEDIQLACSTSASRTIDLGGKMLLPGLVEAHAHLDKAFTSGIVRNDSGTLGEAIRNYSAAIPQFTREVLVARIHKAALRAAAGGATAIRSHVHFPFEHGREAAFRLVHAALEARELLSGIVDIQYVLFVPSRGHTPAMWEAVDEAMQAGMDAVGGAPHIADEPEAYLERLFAIARKYNKDVDLHADETDDPQVQTVSAIAAATIRNDYRGRVVVGHLCSLSAIEESRAAAIIDNMALAQLKVITLPATNLYLQGRGDKGLVRRGVTRVKELMAAGIPVATASDNVQDPFHPYGSGDLLQIGLLTGYAVQMGSADDAHTLLRMLSTIPASLIGLKQYGIKPGLPARFIVFDAQSPFELFAELPTNRWIYRDTRWLYHSRQLSEWIQHTEEVGF